METLMDLLRISIGVRPCACGSHDLDVWDVRGGYAVCCETCGHQGPKGTVCSSEAAVEAWNAEPAR